MTLKVTQNRKRIHFKREACTEAYTEALRHSKNLCNYLYQRTLIFPEILHTSGTLETSKRFLSFLLYAVLLGFSCGRFIAMFPIMYSACLGVRLYNFVC